MRNTHIFLSGTLCITLAALFLWNTQVFAGTTIDSNISTTGNITVNGNAVLGNESGDTITITGTPTFSSNLNINETVGEAMVIDFGTSPDAAATRAAWAAGFGGTVPYASIVNLNTTAEMNGSVIYYTLSPSSSTSSTVTPFSMTLVNNGDASEKVRLLDLGYDNGSTASSISSTSDMIRISMSENVDSFNFQNAINIVAGTTGSDDAGVDNLMVDGIDVKDPDITNAIDVGSNYIRLLDTRVAELTSGVVTFEDNNGNDFVYITDAGSTGNLSVTGSLTVGSGTAMTQHLSATGTVGNGGSNIGTSTCITDAITVSGAANGSTVNLGPPADLEAGLIGFGVVTADGTVTVRLCNASSSAVASADKTWRADVWEH